MRIDHIGIAVKSIEKSTKFWVTAFGYARLTETVLNTRQKVKVAFLTKEASLTVKLIEPTDDTSTISAFVKKGGGLHHLCFRCDDVEGGVKGLVAKRCIMLNPPEPGEAFEGEKFAFLFTPDGFSVELIDTDKRAQLIDTDKRAQLIDADKRAQLIDTDQRPQPIDSDNRPQLMDAEGGGIPSRDGAAGLASDEDGPPTA